MIHENCTTVKYESRVNRILLPISISKIGEVGKKEIKYQALVDTGATQSCITPSTARELGLVSMGMVNMITGGGAVSVNRYHANITLSSGVTIENLSLNELNELATGDHGFDAIIGMDILTLGDASLTTFEGKTVFSFRIPSQHKIDYVAEFNKKQNPKFQAYSGGNRKGRNNNKKGKRKK